VLAFTPPRIAYSDEVQLICFEMRLSSASLQHRRHVINGISSLDAVIVVWQTRHGRKGGDPTSLSCVRSG
jgi:hypothetical protein